MISTDKEVKKITVFTSIRSEYGLLTPLLQELKEHSLFQLEILVGGAHLVSDYGKTISFIEADGFLVNHKFPFLYADEEADVLTRSLSSLQQQIGAYFSKYKPDLLIILGDRFELIPVVLAATLYKVPVAHISGGETTEGAIDNQIRHALTKLSHLHFPATEVYARNILKMGEEPWRICVAGEPGLDLVHKAPLVSKEDLFKDLGLNTIDPVVLMTFHPETIGNQIIPSLIEIVLKNILERGFQVVATAANFDEGGLEINRLYEATVGSNVRFVYHKSLGQKRYYSLLAYAAAMVGNSSSGLVEAQSFSLPVVNVGDRQKGRMINPNVIHAAADVSAIENALQIAFSDEFRNYFKGKPNIYGDGEACGRIISYLQSVDWSRLLSKKDCFYEAV